MDFAATKGQTVAELKVSSVEEINNMVDDEVVYSFVGKVKGSGKYFPPKPDDSTGVGFQVVTLLDTAGKSVKAVFKGQEPVNNMDGKPVVLTAYHGDRGWSGLKAKDNQYKKQDGQQVTERVLWVTKTATVAFSGSTPTQMALPPQKPQGGPIQPQETASEQIIEQVKAARIHVAKLVNLQDLILDGVMALAQRAAERGYTLGPDHLQAVCSTMFITMDRGGWLERMPVAPVQKYVSLLKHKTPAPAPQPAPVVGPEDPFAPGMGSDNVDYGVMP